MNLDGLWLSSPERVIISRAFLAILLAMLSKILMSGHERQHERYVSVYTDTVRLVNNNDRIPSAIQILLLRRNIPILLAEYSIEKYESLAKIHR